MSALDIVLIGGALFTYALISRRLEGTMITAPIVFVVVGFVIGPVALDVLEVSVASAELRLLAEVTLALLLFSDAAALDTRRLRRETVMPARLLGLALPMTIVLGTGLAIVFFPDLLVFEAVALAVLLAPTDAALGQAVVSDIRLPSTVRQGLNVESGLNDGICVPLLLAAIAFAELEEAPGFQGQILVDLIEEVLVAVSVGVGVGVTVAILSRASIGREWMQERWGQIVPLLAAAVAYMLTVEVGGSGFIGAFTAGLIYGRLLGSTAHRSTQMTEDLGQLLSGVTFLLFGAVMIDRGISEFDVEVLVYAALSLTLVRMVPVAIALLGSGAKRETVAFAGWFGPRGLATIVFALTIVEASVLTGTRRIVDVATVTVLLSVILHGVTAPVLTERYVRWIDEHRDRLTFETASHGAVMRSRPSRHSLSSPSSTPDSEP